MIPDPWRGRLALTVILAALVLLIFDKFTQSAREVFLGAAVTMAVLLDCPEPGAWSRRPFLRRVMATLGVFAVSLALAEAVRMLAGRPVARAAAWEAMTACQGWLLWLAALWLLMPVMLDRAANAAGRSAPYAAFGRDERLFRAHLVLLVLFDFGSFLTSLTSLRPDRSFRSYMVEVGAFVPFYLFVVRWLWTHRMAPERLRRWALRVILAATLMGFAVGAAYMAAPMALKEKMEQTGLEYSKLVRREPGLDGTDVWRINFPFGHHNRMAYFSTLACLLLAMGAAGRGRRGWRWIYGTGSALALVNLGLTLNRGGMVGLVAGAWCMLALVAGRRALWPLVLLPVAVLALPHTQKERVLSLFERQTYTSPQSTVYLRLVHWRAAGLMIREYPVLGIGHGWSHFQQYYRDVIKEQLDVDVDETVHAHNAWLQLAAESGLPLVLIFFACQVTRWWLLGRLWRRRAGLTRDETIRLAFWIGIEVTIQFYCLYNYPLRRSLGLLTWGLWAVMLADAALMLARMTPAEAARDAAAAPAVSSKVY